jgi:hypothetical protein
VAKLKPLQVCAIGKVILHGRFNELLRIAVRGKLIHINDQRDWVPPRKFLCPTNDELFRIIIEVSLVERRRIHRVEQLLDSINKNFDSMGLPLRRLQVSNSFEPS